MDANRLIELAHDCGMFISTEMKGQVEKWERLAAAVTDEIAAPALGGRKRAGTWSETCQRCGGQMLPGKALAQTYGGTPDFSCGSVVTMSPRGTGKLIKCLKCGKCGHSITLTTKGEKL